MKTARQFHLDFIEGNLSAQEIVEKSLARIRTYDPQIGAFLTLTEKKAYAQAELLDQKRKNNQPLGPLAGVPIAVKDNIHIEGEKTTCASKMLANYHAPFNATAVESLDKASALFIGKTNLDEFAMGSSTETSAFHPTKNPWDLSCSPGGSSGGSAAAVAARLVPISLGSDTGGSIRQPAALSGIVGFKPSYGRVSRFGLVAFGSSLDQIGPMATNILDIALTMNVISHHCSKDSTSICKDPEDFIALAQKPLTSMKVGVPWHFIDNLADEAKQNFLGSLEVLKTLGCTIVPIDLDILKVSVAIYYILATAEASTNLARFDGIRYGLRSQQAKTLSEVYTLSKQEGFGAEVKRRILLGTYVLSSGHQDSYYHKAQKVRTRVIEAFKCAFQSCSMIAMPVTSCTAFPLASMQDPLQMYLQDVYTIAANLAGLPALSIPSGFDKNNKPWGLQLLGPQLSDASVLQLGLAFEEKTGYTTITPPLFPL